MWETIVELLKAKFFAKENVADYFIFLYRIEQIFMIKIIKKRSNGENFKIR